MGNILISIAPFLWVVIVLAFICVIVSMIMFYMQGVGRNFSFRHNKLLYISLASIVSLVLTQHILLILAKTEFKALIKHDPGLEIVVNSKVLLGDEKNTFINDSLEIYKIKRYAGSRPTKKIIISLNLDGVKHRYHFLQDSRDANLYWVYLPHDLIKIKIGFVKTAVFTSGSV